VAQRIIHKALTCAANTPFNSPDVQALTFLPGDVVSIVVHVRKGHGGLTGLMIYYGGQQVVPSTESAEYLKGDGRTYTFDVELFLTGEGWNALLANTDIYAHTWDIDFELDELTVDADLPIVFVPLNFEGQGVTLAD
jgi:hypothetical protein